MQVGQYAIQSELGRGGFGVVYRAIDEAIGREGAIKAIRFSEGLSPEERAWREQLLLREARAAGSISHPNIVSIYHLFQHADTTYIVMELVQGQTLEQLLREGTIDPNHALRILGDAAGALDYAHSQRIVHCDIKPSNLMIRRDGTLKIADFGIARRLTSDSGVQTATFAGTPCYMAPEQINGQKVEGRADQFSLAVVAYQLLAGQQPFHGDSDLKIMFQVVNKDPAPAHQLNPKLTTLTSRVLMKALSKSPEDRYESCAGFVSDLRTSLSESRVLFYKSSLSRQRWKSALCVRRPGLLVDMRGHCVDIGRKTWTRSSSSGASQASRAPTVTGRQNSPIASNSAPTANDNGNEEFPATKAVVSAGGSASGRTTALARAVRGKNAGSGKRARRRQPISICGDPNHPRSSTLGEIGQIGRGAGRLICRTSPGSACLARGFGSRWQTCHRRWQRISGDADRSAIAGRESIAGMSTTNRCDRRRADCGFSLEEARDFEQGTAVTRTVHNMASD
jgi:serine/threonine protein kinase